MPQHLLTMRILSLMAALALFWGCSSGDSPADGAECTPVDDGDPCTVDLCSDRGTEHRPAMGHSSWRQCRTDITFIAMGDPQYGGGADDKNTFQIAAINRFAGGPWRGGTPSAGLPIAEPLGVLIAGDLTQNGKDGRDEAIISGSDEIGQFILDYGLTGEEGSLNYPVYEGYGNHDFDPDAPATDFDWQFFYTEDPTPAADSVSERNPGRVGLTEVSPATDGHYSWDWGNVHFINANLFPGDEASQEDETSKTRDPRDSLSFIIRDLELHVADSGKPIVFMFHYGFDQFGQEPRWWTDAHKEAFKEAIEPYNVVAILHGHTHATYAYTWEGYDVFNVGSPYYTAYNDDERGHFTLFRITDTTFEVSDIAWTPEAQGTDPAFGNWFQHKELTPLCMNENLPVCQD